MNIQELVMERLSGTFDPEIDQIELIDERGDGRHFLLRMISSQFAGKSRIERSRMIYALLDDLIKKDYLHALRMDLKEA